MQFKIYAYKWDMCCDQQTILQCILDRKCAGHRSRDASCFYRLQYHPCISHTDHQHVTHQLWTEQTFGSFQVTDLCETYLSSLPNVAEILLDILVAHTRKYQFFYFAFWGSLFRAAYFWWLLETLFFFFSDISYLNFSDIYQCF